MAIANQVYYKGQVGLIKLFNSMLCIYSWNIYSILICKSRASVCHRYIEFAWLKDSSTLFGMLSAESQSTVTGVDTGLGHIGWFWPAHRHKLDTK